MDDDTFTDLVRTVLDALPDAFLDTLTNTAVLISDDGEEHRAYGLYRGATSAREDHAIIVIFRDTLLRDFEDDPDRLAAEVQRTVLHEIGHHLGYAERGVALLGL